MLERTYEKHKACVISKDDTIHLYTKKRDATHLLARISCTQEVTKYHTRGCTLLVEAYEWDACVPGSKPLGEGAG